MPYSLSHLQHTAHYIVNRCQYTSGQSISKSDKERLFRDVVGALCELALRNKPIMVIDPTNFALGNLFASLAEHGLEFPENITYLIKPNGKSFEKIKTCDDSVKTKIYDFHEARHDRSARQKYRNIRDETKPFSVDEQEKSSDNMDISDDRSRSLNNSCPWADELGKPPATFLTSYEKNRHQKSDTQARTRERDTKYSAMTPSF